MDETHERRLRAGKGREGSCREDLEHAMFFASVLNKTLSRAPFIGGCVADLARKGKCVEDLEENHKATHTAPVGAQGEREREKSVSSGRP